MDIVEQFCVALSRRAMDAVCDMLANNIFYHNIPMEPLVGKPAVQDHFLKLPFESADWELVSIQPA